MTDEEWLARLDAHMERGNAIMARSNEVMEHNRRAFEDLREYMSMATEALQGLVREIREGRVDMRDLREESRAQREALWRILDRFDERGPPGPEPA